jgi:hypothetical protein
MSKQKAGITRRSLLAGAAAAMAFPSTSILALADDLGSDSLSGAIAGSLAKGAASAGGSYVLGKILLSAGIDLSGQAELNAKLDQILQQLTQIENEITALQTDMDEQLTDLKYNLVYAPIKTLIALNKSLDFYYTPLVKSTSPDEIKSLRKEIRALLSSQNSLVQAMKTWHGAMCGSNGVIVAWGKAVYARNPLFGPRASMAIQKHWRYLDAQQAMTMNYLVEHLNDDPELARQVPRAMEDWRSSRLEQLNLLRGMVDTTDIHYSIDLQTQRASSYLTLLKILPTGVLIDRDTQIMWGLNVRAPVRQDVFWLNRGKDDSSGQVMWVNNNAIRTSGCNLATNYATKTPAEYSFFYNIPCSNWRIPASDELLKLMTKCGGQVGGSGADRFQTAMQSKGFNFPSGQVRLWTSSTGINYGDCPNGRCDPNPHYQVLVEGDNWWNPASKADDTAMVVYCRNLAPGEADNYYYH